MTPRLALGEAMHKVRAPQDTRALWRPLLALPLPSAGTLDKLFYFSESEFPDLVKVGTIREISALLLFTAALI